MTTENSFNKLTHTNSSDIKLKTIQGSAAILKEVFRCIYECNLEELNHLLEGHELAEKSLNITLNKAFGNYKSNSKDSKDIIGILLNYKADPNINVEQNVKNSTIQIDKKGVSNFITGIMYAAIENDVYLANILISHNCNVNAKDHFNRNALFYAIHSSSQDITDMVKILVSSGINLNEVDSEGQSPLTLAVQKGLKDVVTILLNSGADVDHKVSRDGNTALHYAVSNNKPELIYLLLFKKPNLNIKNKKDQTPLEIATNLSSTDCYQILAEEFNQRELNSKKKEDNSGSINNFAVNSNINNTVATNSNTSLNDNINNNSQNSNDILLEEQNFKEDEDNNIRNSFNSNNIPSLNNPNLSGMNYHNFTNLNPNYNNTINKMYIPNSNNNVYNNNITNNYSYPNQNYPNSNIPNLNLNINNNMQTSLNRNGVNNFAQKYSKNAKLQKLHYLQERRMYAEQTGRSIKDKTFKFPFGQNNSNNTNIEIPFNFQTSPEGKIATNSGKYGRGTQLHTFIKIQSTPILHIDISDDAKQDQFILSSQLEELKMGNVNLLKRTNQLENELTNALDENSSLKMEINKLKEELLNKDKIINGQRLELNSKEIEYTNQIETLQSKLEDKNSNYQMICSKYEILEKEMLELKSKECYTKSITDLKSITDKELTKKEFLEKKFSCMKYDEKYIIKCLQRDILDFQEYTKEQIKKVKSTQEELIKLIQDAVQEVMPDYEVKLYGSHATNLCLQWSDLDVVLIHKRNYNASNYAALQSLYINLLEKPWKKQIKLIDSAVVPIIKMTSSEQYNNMHIDISLQDSKHYGLKCVELVKSFMKEYEALEPLIFALKNILKNANLNDPYTGGLSSYGLILMVVSFLQSQQENKKSIKVSDGNLGRMFLEFLWYYGLMFDHSKYVIYAYPTNEVMADKDSINFLFNMQPSHELIIVDPLSKNNNVARSTYQFVNIKMAFMIGFVVSHEECECGCHYNKLGDENNVYNSDHCILKRIFNSVKRFNANTPNS